MLNLKRIRESGTRPRVHGNGFIQLDITKRRRLHVWGHPRIPRQETSTPIHDHVFGFESTILVGRLINVVYDTLPCAYGDFRVYNPHIRDGEDTVLGLSGTEGSVIAVPNLTEMIFWLGETRKYQLKAGVFHETFAPDGPAATVMVKDGPTHTQGAKTSPRVLVPIGSLPDNNFGRYDHDENLLWSITEEVLKQSST